MRNIHLIQTEKPSNLYSFYGILEDLSYGKTFTIATEKVAKINLHKDLKDYQEKLIKAGWKAENIYITSSEVIEETDIWIIWNNLIQKIKSINFRNNSVSFNNDPLHDGYLSACEKIILTTDPDLIKDGVQAIDDEFLQWFVENSSCEEVKIEKIDYSQKCRECEEIVEIGRNCKKGCFMKSGNCICTDKNIKYKIIIPKENKCICKKPGDWDCIYCDTEKTKQVLEESKQETLEEAAEKYVNGFEYGIAHPRRVCKNAFINGAKYQAERMYSEEEVLEILCKSHNVENTSTVANTLKKWFEQFKKR